MESPVMTSASSHRLRSAVSACAQPTHSYLSSSYLRSSVQVESHDCGGCFKKFNNSGKSGDDSLLTFARKPHSSNEFSPLHKRHKLNHKDNLQHRRVKRNAKEVENSSANNVLSLIPKELMLGNDFLSGLKFNGKLLETKKLVDYLGKSPRNESVNNNCEKVTCGKIDHKNNKRNANNGNCGIDDNIILNHHHDNCNKGKSKKSTNNCKKDSSNDESKRSDECSKNVVVHLDEGIKDERQNISKWQPKHVVTRRTAQLVREKIRNVWQRRVGSSKSVHPDYIKILFKDLQLFPSTSKVREMLEYAKESPGKPSAKTVTFGEFFRIAKELFRCEKPYQIARASSLPKILDKNDEKQARKFSKGMSRYEVFLGGSCNPTTWRTDFAIPELEKMGISYYNPQQVEEWRPELMEAEYHAKENATVMFFVLDNQTRGVSALIEAAHLAGNRRKLILVIQSYTQKNSIICDEEISKEEYEDLKSGQEVLRILVERQGIPVFNNIKVALEGTKKILRENLRVQDLQAPVHVNRKTLISPQDVFQRLNSGDSKEISTGDACLALKVLSGNQVSESDLINLITKAGKDSNGTRFGDAKLDFKHFSELVAEFRKQSEGSMPLDPSSSSSFCCKDVYLGGTIENTSWRESIAIPALEEENLSYFVPRISEEGKRFTEIEAAAMDNSFVLLFVITNTARSIAAMAIAGHYIGKGVNVVLCVQHLPENAVIGEEKLSENAVKDYNRGRMYLMDIAERSGVPVCDDITTAVKLVIQKCKS